VLAVVIAFVTLGVVLGLQHGYVSSLEAGLRAGATDLDPFDAAERLGPSPSMFDSLSGFRSPFAESALHPSMGGEGEASDRTEDTITVAMRELRSGDARRVRDLFQGMDSLDPALVPEAIRLLALDDVAREAGQALRGVAARHAGQLVDALLDPASDFAIRRRIPGVVVGTRDPRVIAGLTQGLLDERFEVRYRCGRALARMAEGESDLRIDRDRILSAVHREATIGRKVWDSQRLLDRIEEVGGEGFVDDFVRERAGRSLEHVFTLLSLVLPRDPLRIAFRGLHAGDPMLRGTALEYLESVLPPPIREVLWPYLDTDGVVHDAPHVPRERHEVLQDLMRSNQSIAISLDALRELRRGEDTVERPEE
jgi:hypothetical protein